MAASVWRAFLLAAFRHVLHGAGLAGDLAVEVQRCGAHGDPADAAVVAAHHLAHHVDGLAGGHVVLPALDQHVALLGMDQGGPAPGNVLALEAVHAQIAVVHVDDAAARVGAEQPQRHGVAGGLQRGLAQPRRPLQLAQPAGQQHEAEGGQRGGSQHQAALAAKGVEHVVFGAGQQQLEAEVAQRDEGADARAAVGGGTGAGEQAFVVAQRAPRRRELLEEVAAHEAGHLGPAGQGQPVAAQHDQGGGRCRGEQGLGVLQALHVDEGHDELEVVQRARQAHEHRHAQAAVVAAAAQAQRLSQDDALGHEARDLGEGGGVGDAGAIVIGAGLQAAHFAGGCHEDDVDELPRAGAHAVDELAQHGVGQRAVAAPRQQPQVDDAQGTLGLTQHGLGLDRHGTDAGGQLLALPRQQLAGLLQGVPGHQQPDGQHDRAEGQGGRQQQGALAPAAPARKAARLGGGWRIGGQGGVAHRLEGCGPLCAATSGAGGAISR